MGQTGDEGATRRVVEALPRRLRALLRQACACIRSVFTTRQSRWAMLKWLKRQPWPRKDDEETRPKVQISAEEAAKIIQSHWRKGSTLRARCLATCLRHPQGIS